jgi:hypothetical protein
MTWQRGGTQVGPNAKSRHDEAWRAKVLLGTVERGFK